MLLEMKQNEFLGGWVSESFSNHVESNVLLVTRGSGRVFIQASYYSIKSYLRSKLIEYIKKKRKEKNQGI